MKKTILVITGGSASGKTTLVEMLIRLLLNIGIIQSTTTRKRRIGDTDAEYQFVKFLVFCWNLITGKYVSWRKATKKWFRFNDFYSVRLDKINEALKSDKFFIRSLTPDTISRWNDVAGDRIIFIHILAPDEEEARRRMIARGGMTIAQIDERIREEKNWNDEIYALIKKGIKIHIIPQLSQEETLQRTLEIIKSYE